MSALLRVEDVRLSYGAHEVLKGVSLTVDPGEGFAIIGPNGAGKTTLFRAMTGEARVSAGRVEFDGRDVTRLPAHLRARAGMGRTFQVARVFQENSVRDNVVVAIEARERGAGRAQRPWWAARPVAAVRDEADALLARMGRRRARAKRRASCRTATASASSWRWLWRSGRAS